MADKKADRFFGLPLALNFEIYRERNPVYE